MYLMRVENVYKKYDFNEVLSGASINIEEGKIYIIKGASGSGKSTFLNICSLLENPDKGEVYFKDFLLNQITEEDKKVLLRENIAYIFQDFNLFEDFSVYDNLYLYLLFVSNVKNIDYRTMIESKLKEVGLLSKSKEKAKLLSGGERQRLTLARTLLLKKDIIFADEPSANIDIGNIEIVKKIFIQLKEKGVALLIVTHDNAFDEIADEKYILDMGVLKNENP